MNKPSVTIYSDGSWRAKKQIGAWAALMVCGPHWKVVADYAYNTTISRMELSSVINALKILTIPCNVTIVSDSKLIVNTINEWLHKWENNGFLTANRKPVANQDLLFQLSELSRVHNVEAVWVKAHTKRTNIESLGNAVVDEFAQMLTR